MFEVTGVSKTFSDLQALREVDLSVQAKQTTVLIGPSGCGKSTLIRLMVGLIWPDEGTATLGALIGAGGYGQPILTGIRLDDIGLILQGAVPAALLALIVQGLFELFERVFVSRGLRLKGEINA